MALARYFRLEKKQDGEAAIRCGLCPHACLLLPGKSGLCRVRRNTRGTGDLPYYGGISALNLDPIEKKPLYHFRPGSSVFSVGFVGCNLRCPFCQNWEISQSADAVARTLSPAELIEAAVASRSGAIAYTYSEPLVHIEFVVEAMTLAREAGLANVLVTNGCVAPEAAEEALSLCDAANIDLKTSDERTYGKTLGGDLETVKSFIKTAIAKGVHTEVTTLVVTGMNDSAPEIAACAEFLSGLSSEIPYHLSAYHPAFTYNAPATQARTLAGFAAIAREKLRYVYVGNLSGESNGTRCPVCGELVVRREGYRVDAESIARDDAGIPRCGNCSAPLHFRY